MHRLRLNTAIVLLAGVTAFAQDQPRLRVPLQIRIPIDRLTLLPSPKGRDALFDVHLRVADPSGALSQTADATRQFSVPPADMEKIKGKFYTFQVDLIAETNKQLRVAAGITDVNGKVTSVAVQDITLE